MNNLKLSSLAEPRRPPFDLSQWFRRNLKPYRGLFIALALVVLGFVAVILWFALP